MVLVVLRALFVLLMAAVGYFFVTQETSTIMSGLTELPMYIALVVAVFFVCVDILAPRKKLAIFSGTFFGLVVGIAIAYALSFVVNLMMEQFGTARVQLREYINILVGVTTCYLAISFILQTKDDFRFVIPYVEFNKQTRGARPMLIDTSVLIDGRIQDIASTGLIESRLIVPRFVLNELQQIADSADNLKRKRGRRGLDVVGHLQENKNLEVIIYDSSATDVPGVDEVDQKLMHLAQALNARVLTTDFNLNKNAQLRGVSVININDLANALKPIVLPGERMRVRIVKAGEGPGQGVGYLDDGTMIVIEQGRNLVNEEVDFAVTSVLQTSAGRMIFGKMSDQHPSAREHTAVRHRPA
jgi:uncharacterized protein YacL